MVSRSRRQVGERSFTFRTAQGVWINDMRNRGMPNEQWPCVAMDERTVRDLVNCIRLQAASGFDSLTVFGLLTASSWLPDISGTVDGERCMQVRQVLDQAHACGMKVLYGLGVYSWGFDEIIARDPGVRGPNPHAMCGSRAGSRQWMERVVDYLLAEFDFDGFHLEASDQGRCTCENCGIESNAAYYSRINAQTAEYIREVSPEKVLMVNMCGYLPWGETIPREEWIHLHELGRQLDFLVDAGHAGFYIDPAGRREFIGGLDCAFGTSGGVWTYPPQRWNRLRWFLPYTRRTGEHLETLYAEGGRAIEYYMGPTYNPGVEVNIAFGGRKLADVGRDSAVLLQEVIDELYAPRSDTAAEELARVFEEAEEVFFAHFDPLLAAGGRPRGEIYLEPLKGICPGPAIYLRDAMTEAGRREYGRRLGKLLPILERLEPECGERAKVRRMGRCVSGALDEIGRVG